MGGASGCRLCLCLCLRLCLRLHVGVRGRAMTGARTLTRTWNAYFQRSVHAQMPRARCARGAHGLTRTCRHSDPKTNTIHSIFRRAGLVPHEWNKGWDGHMPFVYNLKSSAAEA